MAGARWLAATGDTGSASRLLAWYEAVAARMTHPDARLVPFRRSQRFDHLNASRNDQPASSCITSTQ
jgi:hypothetical protein